MEVNQIITTLFRDKKIDACCKRLFPSDPDDLKQEVFCALLSKGELVTELQQRGKLLNYTFRTARYIARDKFWSKRAPSEMPEPELTPEDLTDELLKEFATLDKTFGTFYFSELIKAVAKHGSQLAASKALGIPVSSVRRDVLIVREHLRRAVC